MIKDKRYIKNTKRDVYKYLSYIIYNIIRKVKEKKEANGLKKDIKKAT